MRDTVVLGAGIVGISTALALQARGVQVTLIDRTDKVVETSYGNAGAITMESMIPLNNPQLFRQLPKLLLKQTNSLRYSLSYVLSQIGRLTNFVYQAQEKYLDQRVNALHELLSCSQILHKSWLQEAGCLHHLRDNGWLQFYRTEKDFQGSLFAQQLFERWSVNYDILDQQGLAELEPGMRQCAYRALWVHGSSSVDNPAQVAETYKNLFREKGGEFLQANVDHVTPSSDQQWEVSFNDNKSNCKNLVIALGPWSAEFLQKSGIHIPMIYERGSHRIFDRLPGKTIYRPILDIAGGYVVTPMSAGIRLTCGVELNALEAPRSTRQLDVAEAMAKKDFPLGEACQPDWHGCRPTVPDSLPLIGQSSKPGLWINTAHQHVGFASGPASGEILASLMLEQTSPVASAPLFSPQRYKV